MGNIAAIADRLFIPGRRPRVSVDALQADEMSPDSPPPDGEESGEVSELATFHEASPGSTLVGDDASDHSREPGDPVSFSE